MSKTSHVVDGEASESDTEIEIGKSPGSDTPKPSKALVFDGEAPESEDESKVSHLSTEPDLPLHMAGSPPNPMRMVYTSLLHQKLWESNISLRATLEGLLKHTTDIAVEKLTRSDKILLNVQESMRSTNANLTLARARLKQIHDELEKANCNTALPTVRVKQ